MNPVRMGTVPQGQQEYHARLGLSCSCVPYGVASRIFLDLGAGIWSRRLGSPLPSAPVWPPVGEGGNLVPACSPTSAFGVSLSRVIPDLVTHSRREHQRLCAAVFYGGGKGRCKTVLMVEDRAVSPFSFHALHVFSLFIVHSLGRTGEWTMEGMRQVSGHRSVRTRKLKLALWQGPLSDQKKRKEVVSCVSESRIRGIGRSCRPSVLPPLPTSVPDQPPALDSPVLEGSSQYLA